MMKNKELTVLYFNARSIRNKISDLDTALNTAKYDFVFISETWLNETNLSSSIINTVHYSIVRNDRRTHAGGVAAIYQAKYADKIVVHTVDPNELCGFELLAFDLYVNSRYNVCFICVYLSPHESKNPSTVISLLRVLKRFMKKKRFTSSAILTLVTISQKIIIQKAMNHFSISCAFLRNSA